MKYRPVLTFASTGFFALVIFLYSGCQPLWLPFVIENRTDVPIQVKVYRPGERPDASELSILPGQERVIWSQRMSSTLCTCCSDGLEDNAIRIMYPNDVSLLYPSEELKKVALFHSKGTCKYKMDVVLKPQIETKKEPPVEEFRG